MLIASFAVMQFFFAPIIGKVSDQKGRKIIILFSLLISFISFTLFSFANSYYVLLFFFANSLLTASYGLVNTAVPVILSKKSSSAEEGSILGIAESIVIITTIPGPSILGANHEITSEFIPFLISSIILFIAFVIVYQVLIKGDKSTNRIFE